MTETAIGTVDLPEKCPFAMEVFKTIDRISVEVGELRGTLFEEQTHEERTELLTRIRHTDYQKIYLQSILQDCGSCEAPRKPDDNQPLYKMLGCMGARSTISQVLDLRRRTNG